MRLHSWISAFLSLLKTMSSSKYSAVVQSCTTNVYVLFDYHRPMDRVIGGAPRVKIKFAEVNNIFGIK